MISKRSGYTNQILNLYCVKFQFLRGNEGVIADIVVIIELGVRKKTQRIVVMCDKNLLLQEKEKLNTIVVRREFMFESECWPLNRKDEIKMEVVEVRNLGWM